MRANHEPVIGVAIATATASMWRSRPAVTRTRKRIAFSIAALSDLAQWFLFPVLSEGWLSPLEIALDAGTALPILLVVGFHCRLAVVLVAELVPGVDMSPHLDGGRAEPPDRPPPLSAASPWAQSRRHRRSAREGLRGWPSW
jgi:hypothetical protein